MTHHSTTGSKMEMKGRKVSHTRTHNRDPEKLVKIARAILDNPGKTAYSMAGILGLSKSHTYRLFDELKDAGSDLSHVTAEVTRRRLERFDEIRSGKKNRGRK